MIYLLICLLACIVVAEGAYFKYLINKLEKKQPQVAPLLPESTRSMFSIMYGNK